jgi:hypothetical protein
MRRFCNAAHVDISGHDGHPLQVKAKGWEGRLRFRKSCAKRWESGFSLEQRS